VSAFKSINKCTRCFGTFHGIGQLCALCADDKRRGIVVRCSVCRRGFTRTAFLALATPKRGGGEIAGKLHVRRCDGWRCDNTLVVPAVDLEQPEQPAAAGATP
jgi:hypothetical protein